MVNDHEINIVKQNNKFFLSFGTMCMVYDIHRVYSTEQQLLDELPDIIHSMRNKEVPDDVKNKINNINDKKRGPR